MAEKVCCECFSVVMVKQRDFAFQPMAAMAFGAGEVDAD
jgi:hypothetical protein